ncbi:sel1 repeat family protein [Methylocystis sp. 9N]|uniref:Sel1 repeat family protein n=1 Tax=Methylocystis borbori TaxID=3118750 RepID=A0ABU7XI29_9HYPH
MLKRCVHHALMLATAALLLSAGSALAEEKRESFNAANARTATAAMDRDEALLAASRLCPADAFGKSVARRARPPSGESAGSADCATHPEKCYRACVAGGPEHCFRLALAFQENEDVVAPRYAQRMFSMACALGEAAGCTNRAAHMRNGADEGDPLKALSQPEKDRCQFRSFKIACAKNDNWGCAMLGQAYSEGEGVRKNVKRARRYYLKSCRLDADFDACAFARRARKQRLEARR